MTHLNRVNGFLKRHHGGWPANIHNNKRGGRKGRRRKEELEGSGIAGQSAMYPQQQSELQK